METLLYAENINKTYAVGGERQEILKNVSLTIEAGEFVSVMGPSGSGKSTLLYNLSGLDQPDSGSVKLAGRELTALQERELAALRLNEMGFIFQQSNLLKNLNLFDNIVLAAYLAKRHSRSQINRRAQALMQRMGVAQLADRDVSQASGGQLQRVAICRALIQEPRIIFGDEPTGALNSQASAEVLDLLADLNAEGATILLVTHDAKVAAKTECTLYMTDGEIVGELRQGKYEPQAGDLTTRESKLNAWLSGLGF